MTLVFEELSKVFFGPKRADVTLEETEERARFCCYIAAFALFVTIISIFIPLHPVLAFSCYATTILFAFLTIWYWYRLRVLTRNAEIASVENSNE